MSVFCTALNIARKMFQPQKRDRFVLTCLLSCAVLVLSSSPTQPQAATPVQPKPSPRKQAVVVGGGPVGLATAIALSKPPHSYNVSVLEQSEPTEFDPGRSYLYNVNQRGLTWVATHPKAMERLELAGSGREVSMGSIVYIPSDPTEPIEQPQNVAIAPAVPTRAKRNYWVPRHRMVDLLQECCKEIQSIQVLSRKTVVSLELPPSGNATSPPDQVMTVQCSDGSSYPATLVVAADGISSTIRTLLAEEHPDKPNWFRHDPATFRLRSYKSPSTGLKMKALLFPPGFGLPQSDGSLLDTHSETIYVYRSINKGTKNSVSLGLLPVKDPNMLRPANINTRYDHEIWSLETGVQAKVWFQKSFPRIDFDALVGEAEWDRFATEKGTTYPYCQYSPGSAVSTVDGSLGVVMLGDACHAFPPDIGQGINSGLQDVVALDRALQGQDLVTGEFKSPPESLGAALEAYQKNRVPEHHALIRLAHCGSPYQYRQSWIRDRIGRLLWMMNVWFRMVLNKISRGLIPPAAIALAQQNPELTFRQIMRRSDLTVFVLSVLLGGFIAALLL